MCIYLTQLSYDLKRLEYIYFHYYYYYGKVNEYPESIGLTNNFRNIL